MRIPPRKRAPVAIITGAIMISVTVILFHGRQTEKHIEVVDSNPANPSGKQAHEREESCQAEIFSSGEVHQMCSAAVLKPQCLVDQIDHLKSAALNATTLRLPGGHVMKIFLNRVVEKTGMARQLATRGIWESESVNLVMSALRNLPKNSALIDVGCSFGVYTLAAASLGNKVVAMDANYRLAMRVRKSIEENSLDDRVDVFWNAISAQKTNVRLRYPTANCDFGMLRTYNSDNSQGLLWTEDPVEVPVIGLDDIVMNNFHLKTISHLVLKVDIEGSEWNVFATAARTFERFNVAMVLMEWEWTMANFPHKTPFICTFFTSRGFSAYAMKAGKPTAALQVEDRLKWPPDVLWINRKSGLVDKLAG